MSENFLADSGSDVSILPLQFGVDSYLNIPDTPKLFAANNRSIKVAGHKHMHFQLQDFQQKFEWTFLVPNVTQPQDFLSHHNLLIDCRNNKLIHGNYSQIAHVKSHSSKQNVYQTRIANSGNVQKVQKLLEKYPEITHDVSGVSPIAIKFNQFN